MNIWSRLGLSVAIASVFCIVVMEVFQNKTYYQLLKWYASGTFGATGMLLLLIAWHLRNQSRRHTEPATQNGRDEDAVPAGSSAWLHLAFWGPNAIVFGLIVSLLPYKDEAAVVVAQEPTPALPTNPPPATAPVAEVSIPEPLSFPELKIQGIVYRPPRSAVIINGKSFFKGDDYKGAEIVSVDKTSIMLEMNEQRKVVLIQPPEIQ